MGVNDRRRLLFEQIVRLRRAERAHTADREIVAVRTQLERKLGPTVSYALAADLLGVSHTIDRRWNVAGELPTVGAPDGRSGVPVRALLALYEQVQDALDGRPGASSHLAVGGGGAHR